LSYRHIIRKSFEYIKINNIEASPKVYRDIFCSIAKVHGLKTPDCLECENYLQKLDPKLKAEAELWGIDNTDKLIDFLLNKIKNPTNSESNKNGFYADLSLAALEVQKDSLFLNEGELAQKSINAIKNGDKGVMEHLIEKWQILRGLTSRSRREAEQRKSDGGSKNELLNDIPFYKRLLIKSLTPSFNAAVLKRVQVLSQKLRSKDFRISNSDLNNYANRLIAERIQGDRSVILGKLFDFNAIVDVLNEKLNKILHQTNSHTSKLAEIQKKINEIKQNENSSAAFELIKEKLTTMNKTLTQELAEVRSSVQNQQNELVGMKKSIDQATQNNKTIHHEVDTTIEHESAQIELPKEKSEVIEIFETLEEGFVRSGKNYIVIYYRIAESVEIEERYGGVMLRRAIMMVEEFIKRGVDSEDIVKAGEEGIFILSNKEKNIAQEAIERIQKVINQKRFRIKHETVSLSSNIGIASREEHISLEETVQTSKKLLG